MRRPITVALIASLAALAPGCAAQLAECDPYYEICPCDPYYEICDDTSPTPDDRRASTRDREEICDDGTDGDDDGIVDEGCGCPALGEVRPCSPAGCFQGTQRCEESGTEFGRLWSSCLDVVPTEETCGDGNDYDCDGVIDEGCAGCSHETCDGTDEDCDSFIDEGACGAAPTDPRTGPAPPSVTCPSPTTTTPLVGVGLTGSATDADGVIVAWQWTLASAPAGAGGTFSAPTSASTHFTPNLVGVYTVRLTVTDDAGLSAACTTTVTALGRGLRIELTWNTDLSDVDVHLLRTAGSTGWSERPNDCFWNNPRPSWDAAGTADDPRLDIDDVNGYGPENINLDVPVTGSTYRVGVHYWKAHGAGATTATVRIYCGEIDVTPRATYARTLSRGSGPPADNDFWVVANVRWDGGSRCSIETLDHLRR